MGTREEAAEEDSLSSDGRLLLHRSGAGEAVSQIRQSYEDRIRVLEDAILSRDRALAHLRDSIIQSASEYQQVSRGTAAPVHQV